MGFSSQSVRHRLAVAAVALASLFTLTPTTPLQAQDLAPGGVATATEPVVVVTLGSVNKLMQDIDYLTSTVGQPQAGGIFRMMAGTFTQGVDTTQPIGILVPLVDGMPQPIAIVPTADVKAVLKRLEAQTGPADELDDGTLVIALGASTVYIRQSGNWAVLAPNRDVLTLAPADPTSLFEGLGNRYDLAFRLKMQKIPPQMREMLTAQIRQGFEQAMAQQAGEDTESARRMAENTLEQLDQLINETDELKFGLNVDQTGKKVAIDTMFTAVPGSKLAAIYGAQRPIPSQFSAVIRDDAAAFYHGATSISPEAVEQARMSVSNSLQALRQALKSEGNLNEQQQRDITEMIDRIGDLAVDSVSEGRADVGAVLLTDETDFRFVLGAFVADGNRAAQIVKDLAKKVEGQPDAPRFSFDQGTYKGVTMHMVEADVPEKEDEARRIFGETLRVHVGTGPKSVYLSVGKDSEALMKELIDSGSTDAGAGRPVGQMRVTLMPILQYAQSIESNDALAAMIDALSRAPDSGEFSMVQQSIANGQELTIRIGEGILQAVGAAARQAQMKAQQGGEF